MGHMPSMLEGQGSISSNTKNLSYLSYLSYCGIEFSQPPALCDLLWFLPLSLGHYFL